MMKDLFSKCSYSHLLRTNGETLLKKIANVGPHYPTSAVSRYCLAELTVWLIALR